MSIQNDTNEYLTFTLGAEEYGIGITAVNEIKCWEDPRPIPDLPSYIKGVISIRGEVIPVLDIREKFGYPTSYNDTTVIIILNIMYKDKEQMIGIVVDAVSDVYIIEEDAIKETPKEALKMRSNYVTGIAMVNEKMVMLMDIGILATFDDSLSNLAVETEKEKEKEKEEKEK